MSIEPTADAPIPFAPELDGSVAKMLASAAGVWRWNVPHGRLQADARFAELYGLDRLSAAHGLPADAFFSAIHPDDRLRIRIAVAGVMHGADVFSKEFRVAQPGDGVQWVSAKGWAERDEAGKVIRFEGVLTDITDLKRVEERLRVAQSAGGVGAFEYINGYGTVNVSEQFCRLLGLTPTDALALRAINAVLPAGQAPLIGGLDESVEGDQPTREFQIARADTGAVRWIARRGEVRRDAPDGGLRFIGVIHDITEAKALETKLRELTSTLEQRVAERTRERDRVWNNSRDLLLVLDPQGVVVAANPAWTRILGLQPEEVVGKTRRDLILDEDIALSAAAFETLRGGGDLENLVTRFRHADGGFRWISWRAVLDDGMVFGYGRDVTDEREQAAVLDRTAEQLRQAQKMEAVGQLTGGLAHDFNNMLTGIIGGLDIIRRRIAAGRLDDLDRFMDSAVASAQRAAGLTHRLLAFSRQQSLDPQPIDPGALAASMEDMLARTLGEQVRLTVSAAPDLWTALADANQLESAILNLAINARDAMPDGGALVIEARNVTLDAAYAATHPDATAGDYVAISVTDTGAGMPPDVAERAFDPFFTTKPIGQGTGLGLSMIYGFMRQIGGHAALTSVPGEGTAVTMFVPRYDGEAPAEARPASAPLPAGGGESVLVVEDEPSVRMLIVDALGELGYRALEAENGEKAIAVLKSGAPVDLLISDVGLPGLNGRQVAEIARRHRPGLRVLFVTGYAPGATTRASFLAPGMDMIAKPFAMGDLAAKISEMLAG